MTLDWHALAEKYNTDPATLTPETLQQTADAFTSFSARREKLAHEPSGLEPLRHPLGLTDNYEPFTGSDHRI
jgi:hypothetical protein